MIHNSELDLAFDFVQYTNRNIFLTGKAGTGKTTFLHKLKEVSPKRMIVVAPTGVAAINAGGVTSHSFFQMPFGPILPGRLSEVQNDSGQNSAIRKFNKRKINIIRSLDLLVIDEISMVRADLLDGIDQVLRRYKNKNKPFGGAQVLMIGDLQQLAPVVKENEWRMLRDFYETAFFFSSKVFQQADAVSIELKHIYRQKDNEFIRILNEIRDNRLSPESLETLNKRHIPGFQPKSKEGYIILTTHNAIANRINQEQLEKVKAREHTFEAEIQGQFPEHSFPAEQFLALKEGAQVMFIKNDSSPEKRFFNGKIGRVVGIEDDSIFVQCDHEDNPIEVGREMWENIRYSINERSKEIEEAVAGSFIQYPLRLAWAITIHKSQGLTFDKAVIDANAAFAHGQTYVALSRCKSLEGLVLSTKISPDGIICDPTVGKFNNDVEQHQPDEKVLSFSKQNYRLELLDELFSYRQLQYHFEKCKTLVAENKRSIQGDIGEKIDQILQNGIPPLKEVGTKFMAQLRYITQQESSEAQFQDRIKKGANYFGDQTEKQLAKPFNESELETDNTAVRKVIRETIEKIDELIIVKLACLNVCKNGFILKDYLHVRATAALEKPTKATQEKTKITGKMSSHPKLYEYLREWRNRIALDAGIPHYRVISQRALLGISNTVPGNENKLLEVKGFGKMKFKKFGEDILHIVSQYCDEHSVEPTLSRATSKPVKKDTKKITFELFKEGKSITEIAKIRNFTENTIESHLAHYVGLGELDIHLFVDKKTRETISDFFEENPGAGLSLAKEALDNKITYSQIKMVRSHLEFLTNQ
ncbi:MAG: helix-turn-helix domain-containing protein [Bacteroidetes bacterium]|nr:helix-turn-helix domain-containing protein [Bacteroidota bacterium]